MTCSIPLIIAKQPLQWVPSYLFQYPSGYQVLKYRETPITASEWCFSRWQWQDVDTQGASDVEVIKLVDRPQLLVIANSRSNSGLTRVMSTMYEWDAGRQQIRTVQYIATQGAKAVQFFTDHSINYVAFANSFDSISQAYEIKSVFLCFTVICNYFFLCLTFSALFWHCKDVTPAVFRYWD